MLRVDWERFRRGFNERLRPTLNEMRQRLESVLDEERPVERARWHAERTAATVADVAAAAATPLSGIGEVVEVYGQFEVNQHLADGWTLLLVAPVPGREDGGAYDGPDRPGPGEGVPWVAVLGRPTPRAAHRVTPKSSSEGR